MTSLYPSTTTTETAMTFAPTAEQQAVIAAALTGRPLAVEALAGTGKTSTLVLVAQALHAAGRRGVYTTFNKANVLDARTRFPSSCRCATAHSLAMGAVGQVYRARMDSPRMKPWDIAKFLKTTPFEVSVGDARKTISAQFVSGAVLRTIDEFCKTGDRTPGAEHVPYLAGLDDPSTEGAGRYAGLNAYRRHVAQYLPRAWADLSNLRGVLPFSHQHYLKIWQLSDPKIDADYILFDEAQDASGVMRAVVEAQAGHAQLIYVGDSYQAINEWNGAVNALAQVTGDRLYLTQSFRFGAGVADVANLVLAELEAPRRVIGDPSRTTVVATVDDPDAILCRTNAVAVATTLELLRAGRRVALVGGAGEIVKFARGAADLKEGRRTNHVDLAPFSSWAEVQDYVSNDPMGGDLKRMVDLIDEYSPQGLIEGLANTVDESLAELVVSTAHRSKGREWPSVRLAGDFPDPDKRVISAEEDRLLYVAVTRAREVLDLSAVPSGRFPGRVAV